MKHKSAVTFFLPLIKIYFSPIKPNNIFSKAPKTWLFNLFFGIQIVFEHVLSNYFSNIYQGRALFCWGGGGFYTPQTRRKPLCKAPLPQFSIALKDINPALNWVQYKKLESFLNSTFHQLFTSTLNLNAKVIKSLIFKFNYFQ